MVRLATTADRNREQLNAAYIASHQAVLDYLNAIHQLIHDMPAPETNGLDWSHVGSMNKVKGDLQDIVRFLGGETQ